MKKVTLLSMDHIVYNSPVEGSTDNNDSKEKRKDK